MLDREVLHRVVLVGPVLAGVSRPAGVRGVDRDVRSTGEDRSHVVVDENLLLADRVWIVEATLAGAGVARIGHLRDLDLVHLPDLFGQRHPRQQVVDTVRQRLVGIEIGRPVAGDCGRAQGDADQHDC